MIHIAHWGIFNKRTRQITKIAYKDKEGAEKILELMQRSEPDAGYYLNLVKEPLTAFPNKLILVLVTSQKISGSSVDKHTGEHRRWSKTFHHIETHAVVGHRVLTEHFKSHIHRGELRINGPCGRMNKDQFEEWAKKRWPDGWEQVMLRIEG